MLVAPWPVTSRPVGADGADPPEPEDPLPVMEIPALLGVPIAAPPPAFDSATVKVLLPENGTELLIVTVNVFGVPSPSPHCKVPLEAVKSVPAAAVPSVAAWVTLIAPVEPP